MSCGRPPVVVRVLGAVDVVSVGGIVPAAPSVARAGQVRRLLSVLVTRVNYLASADWLADCLWGDRQPALPSGALHNLVSRLRAVLSAAGAEDVQLLTQPPGYCLKLNRSSLDSLWFEDLAVSARTQLADDPAAAAERLDEALSWWQGPAYAEFADEDFARPSAARLTELKMLAEEDRAEADLLLDRPEAAGARLGELATHFPLRERLHAQLMLAVYRSGRPADAAEIYRGFAHRIREDLGLDPTPRVRELQARILRADPTLMQSRSHPPHTRVDAGVRPASLAPSAPLNQPLYGRDSAVAEVCDALGIERVVTLSGPGGVGKTSLARAVLGRIAGRYRDGAYFCELTTVARSQSILAPMARALQMPAEFGEISATAVVSYLADRQMLLVLDNCEHVLDEVIDITAQIMQRCPDLVVLTTSRAPLRVAEERVVPVPPLRVPPVGLDDVAAIGEYEAVQLFWARARQRQRSFDLAGSAEAVAELCRRLDGLPLALELAAARMTTMAPAELVERLQWRLDVLAEPSRPCPPPDPASPGRVVVCAAQRARAAAVRDRQRVQRVVHDARRRSRRAGPSAAPGLGSRGGDQWDRRPGRELDAGRARWRADQVLLARDAARLRTRAPRRAPVRDGGPACPRSSLRGSGHRHVRSLWRAAANRLLFSGSTERSMSSAQHSGGRSRTIFSWPWTWPAT